MRKIWQHTAVFFVCIFMLAPKVLAEALIPVGEVIGIQLADGSVRVAAFDESLGDNAKSAGLQVGDRILSVDSKKITCVQDIRYALERSDGTVQLAVLREGKEKRLTMSPKVTGDGPKLGIYLKQGITGVGTVTWYDPETGDFGALGHGVNDPDGSRLVMEQGNVYKARVEGVNKGQAGQPGQLMGAMTESVPLGELSKNTRQGIFGKTQTGWMGESLDLMKREEVKTGPAVIRSTVDDSRVQEYSVEILKIYPNSDSSGRNMLIKVTDPRLLETTGGIVQGMSGSPIIQNGKLIGAVTHVLVNDPTMGYGIFIENMLDAVA